MQLGPVLTTADKRGREHDGVESDVVLAHKLEEVNLFGVLPPLLPVLGVAVGDR